MNRASPSNAAALAAGLMLSAALPAGAATLTIVDGNATPGAVNTSVGDLGAPSGTLPWFPAPNTFTGIDDQVFASAPDLSGAEAALGDWLTNPTVLNSNWNTPGTVPDGWPVNTEIAVIYAFDAGPGLTDITADFELVDNGIHIWVNGVWQFGGRDPQGRSWTDIALGGVGPGTNFIQILLEDSGGATRYVNPSISGTVVPLPAAGWLLASAIGLAGLRRRRR